MPGANFGFRNAPITKALLLCVSGCSLAAHLLDRKSLFQLQFIPQITTNHEFWRFLTSNIALTTSGEFFFGSVAIYQLRIIEQQFGSSKYAAFFFITTALSTIFGIGASFFGRSYELTHIPPGPYGFIFAALYQHMKMIPSIHQYKLLGLPFSEKILVYCMGALPLLAFQYPHSIVGGACGILAGIIYRNNILRMKKWRFPQFINRFASRFILPLISTTSSSTSTTGRSSFTIDRRPQSSSSSSSTLSTNDLIRRQTRVGSPSVAQAIVNEDDVANLRAMFPQSSQEVITQALESANNDINRAAQFLLDHRF